MRHRVAWAAAAAVGLVAAGAAVMTGPASAAGAGCSVQYKVVSEWQGGFQGDVAITNLGDPWSSWTLEFDFPNAGQGVNNGWSADWSQSGAHVTAKSLSWNGAVASNGSVSVGFIGTWSGGNPAPTAFRVNGVACGGATSSPSPSPSPSPTRSPSPSLSPTRSPSPSPTRSPSPSPSPSPGPGGAAPQLHVSGNKIVTADGKPYRLLGVDRSSGEYACVQGKGTWDYGPVDQASVDAMKTWNIHAVRIPLNEECWLGTNGSPSGAAYQQDVKDYVNLLVANGITPILDLHWNWGQFTGVSWACTDTAATCQKPMPDAKYAPQFWTGVAQTFKGNDAVVFDLFNEPWPEYGTGDTTSGWTCLRDGGNCPGIPYEVAGMQSLVDAVRATGATNIVMVGGLAWSNDLSQWQQYKPNDPTGNLVASWHSYSFNYCSNEACWDSQIAPLAAKVPVVTGEFGADNCAYDYLDRLTKWADTNGVSYLAWTWSPWGCSTGAVLIKDYAGTPEPGVGEGYKAHLLTQNPYA